MTLDGFGWHTRWTGNVLYITKLLFAKNSIVVSNTARGTRFQIIGIRKRRARLQPNEGVEAWERCVALGAWM